MPFKIAGLGKSLQTKKKIYLMIKKIEKEKFYGLATPQCLYPPIFKNANK